MQGPSAVSGTVQAQPAAAVPHFPGLTSFQAPPRVRAAACAQHRISSNHTPGLNACKLSPLSPTLLHHLWPRSHTHLLVQAEGLRTGSRAGSADLGPQSATQGNPARLAQENQQLRGQLLELAQQQEWALGSVVASKDREIAELASRLRCGLLALIQALGLMWKGL